MGKIVREFATHWNGGGRIFFERDEDELVGTQRSGGRPLPRVRVFDLCPHPTHGDACRPPVLWAGQDGIVEAHYLSGAEPHFHRPSDFDVLVLQFSGRAVAETEFGERELAPGHAMHIPAGVAYRFIGNPYCRQLVTRLREPVKLGVDPNKPLTETVFNIHREDESAVSEPVKVPKRMGKVLEFTEFWAGAVDPIVIERDHAKLVGCATSQSTREISVLRAFDYFAGMTGKGTVRAPQLYESDNFRVDVYNTEGQQHGFHRGCDDDEIWFQFRGHAVNDTEWGVHELDPGEIGYVPRGIAHRITGGPGFLRFNLYFHHLMQPCVDESSHHGRTSYVVETASFKELPALAETKARIEAARAKGDRPRM